MLLTGPHLGLESSSLLRLVSPADAPLRFSAAMYKDGKLHTFLATISVATPMMPSKLGPTAKAEVLYSVAFSASTDSSSSWAYASVAGPSALSLNHMRRTAQPKVSGRCAA